MKDDVVAETTAKVVEEFPWVSALAVMSHMTLSRTHAVFSAALSMLYDSGLNLSRSRLNALWLLYRMDRRLTTGELSAYQGVRVPSTIRMVQSLAADGWVQTIKGESDRRLTFIELTPEGRERLGKLLPEAFKIWEDLWSGLTDEEKQLLIGLLTKLRGNLLSRYIGEAGLAVYLTAERPPADPNE